MPVLGQPNLGDAGPVDVDFDANWAVQSMFGGAIAAVAVRAARLTVARPVLLSDAQFHFIAPTPPGRARVHVAWQRGGRRFADAEVRVESHGVTVLRAALAFGPARDDSAILGGPFGSLASPPPGWHMSRPFGGGALWSAPRDWRNPGRRIPRVFRSFVRPAGVALALHPDEWACIAADLVGPAIVRDHAEPFAVSTGSLALTLFASAPTDRWWRQTVTADVANGVADGDLALECGGRLLGRAHQRAVVAPAGIEDSPRLVTAFADSAIASI